MAKTENGVVGTAAGTSIQVQAGQNILLDAATADLVVFSQGGNDLIITAIADGNKIVLEDFFSQATTDLPPQLTLSDGSVITAAEVTGLVEQFDPNQVAPAAGPGAGGQGGGGAGFGDYDDDGIGNGIGISDLLGRTGLEFPEGEIPEELQGIVEDAGVDPEQPVFRINEIGLSSDLNGEYSDSATVDALAALGNPAVDSFLSLAEGSLVNYIELFNYTDTDQSTGGNDGVSIEGVLTLNILGPDGATLTIGLPTVTVPAGGHLVIMQAAGEGGVESVYVVFDASGSVVSAGDVPDVTTAWPVGTDTTAELGVILSWDLNGEEAALDTFLANGAAFDAETLEHFWTSALGTTEALDIFGDNGSFNGQISTQEVVAPGIFDVYGPISLAELVECSPIAETFFLDIDVNNIFARVDQNDSDTEADWTTGQTPSIGTNDVIDPNPQDPYNDDMNPGQLAGPDAAAGEDTDTNGQNIIIAGTNAAAFTNDAGEIEGGRAQDFLFGDEAENILKGGSHNDFLDGGAGNDMLLGESGGDVIIDDHGQDMLVGGTGTDILFGRRGPGEEVADTMDGGEGNDTMDGGYGNDFYPVKLDLMYGGYGNDLDAEEGDEIGNEDGAFEFGTGDLLIGDEIMEGGFGNDFMYGGQGNDFMYGGAGNDTMDGVEDDRQTYMRDIIVAGDGSDIIYGDNAGLEEGFTPADIDALYGDIMDLMYYNGPYGFAYAYRDYVEYNYGGADLIYGGWGDDIIFGQGGDDAILAGHGDDIVAGGSGADKIRGNGGHDSLYGDSGDDTMFGDAGRDFMMGLEDNDEMHGGAGNDNMKGGGGDDLMYGDAEGDHMEGNDGNDSMYGGTGNDYMNGDDGEDVMYGNEERDNMHGGYGNDVMFGGTGNDHMGGGSGNDIMDGGANNDYMHGDDGDDTMFGGTGNDDMDGNYGNDSMLGGGGNDDMSGNDGNDAMHGGSGNDRMNGNDDNDVMYGDDGVDVMYGNSGDDTLYGGADRDFMNGDDYSGVTVGNDLMYGDDGDDVMRGQGGDDTMHGDNHLDYMEGNDGNDVMHGGSGNDFMYGNDDDDLMYGDEGDDHMDGNDGTDTLYGGSGSSDTMYGGNNNDLMYGDDGDDAVIGDNDFMFGDSGDDTMFGDGGADSMYGGTGNDEMSGGYGADTMYGGSGNDTMSGADGNDVIYGDAGDDQLLATPAAGATEYFYGGSGTDTLSFTLTDAQIADTDFMQLLYDAYDWLGINSLGAGAPAATDSFNDTASGYEITVGNDIENLIATDSLGGAIDLTGPAVTVAGALFGEDDDNVNFNTVAPGDYIDGTQHDALGGNDTVYMPTTKATSDAHGLSSYKGTPYGFGSGDDTVYLEGYSFYIKDEDGNDDYIADNFTTYGGPALLWYGHEANATDTYTYTGTGTSGYIWIEGGEFTNLTVTDLGANHSQFVTDNNATLIADGYNRLSIELGMPGSKSSADKTVDLTGLNTGVHYLNGFYTNTYSSDGNDTVYGSNGRDVFNENITATSTSTDVFYGNGWSDELLIRGTNSVSRLETVENGDGSVSFFGNGHENVIVHDVEYASIGMNSWSNLQSYYNLSGINYFTTSGTLASDIYVIEAPKIWFHGLKGRDIQVASGADIQFRRFSSTGDDGDINSIDWTEAGLVQFHGFNEAIDTVHISGLPDGTTTASFLASSVITDIGALIITKDGISLQFSGKTLADLPNIDFKFGDYIGGTQGAETLTGGDGDDILFADDGINDVLIGGAGDDTLIGGHGDDYLRGGTGADVFRTMNIEDGEDVILDFIVGDDVIDLDDLFDVLNISGADRANDIHFDTTGTGLGNAAIADTKITIDGAPGFSITVQDVTLSDTDFGTSIIIDES